MRWSDAACREQIVVSRAQRIDRLNDTLLDIRNDTDLSQPDTLQIEPERDLRNILILRTARQDFIANDAEGGGPDAFFGFG
jgi:hypothetical protein